VSYPTPNRNRVLLVASLLAALGLTVIAPGISSAPRQTSKQTTDNQSSNRATASSPVSTKSSAAKTVTRRESIPFTVSHRSTSQLRSGASRTIRNGIAGEKEIVYRLIEASEGTKAHREIVSTRILKKPVPEIVEEGRSTQLASRGGYFSGRRIVMMVATTYDPYNDGSNSHGRTYSGLLGGYGVVAVDPRFIPLGTRLFVEGYGYAVAADIGGAIKGNRIDLAIDSKHDAKSIDDWQHVRVHILD